MKKPGNCYQKKILLTILGSLIFGVVFAQKERPRISADYIHEVGVERYVKASLKYRSENGVIGAMGEELVLYQEVVEDSLIKVSSARTNHDGDANLPIAESYINQDSADYQYVFHVKLEDSEILRSGSKSVKFVDAYLKSQTIEIDSIVNVKAILTDKSGEPIEGAKLSVMVDRLFAPLTIGESSYETDEDGTVIVPMNEPLPGVDGVLNFIVVMEARKYGTVKQSFESEVGVAIQDLSTFDERTMWSPPNKTPWFLLIFPNLLILGMWAVIVLLAMNLYKISKSNIS